MSGNRCMMKLISGSNLSKQKELLLWEEINQVQFLNPIPTGLWNDVTNWLTLLVPDNVRLSKTVETPSDAMNLISSKHFGL